jgi:hypothetical protein
MITRLLPILPIKKYRIVTSNKDNAKYEVTQINLIQEHIHSSVLSDEIIEVEITNGTVKTKLKLRKIKYYDREHKRSLNFLVICLTSDPTQ